MSRRTPQQIASDILAYPMHNPAVRPVNWSAAYAVVDKPDAGSFKMLLKDEIVTTQELAPDTKKNATIRTFRWVHSTSALEKLLEALEHIASGKEPGIRERVALSASAPILLNMIQIEQTLAKKNKNDIAPLPGGEQYTDADTVELEERTRSEAVQTYYRERNTAYNLSHGVITLMGELMDNLGIGCHFGSERDRP